MPTIDLGSVVGPQGPQGVQGIQGVRGEQGAAGPNQVTGSTSTTLSGVLFGNGSAVSAKALDSTGGAASAASVALKAPLASPALTGTPTAPTAAAGTNTAQIATTAFVAAGLSAKAPTGHASTATTYGKGTSSNYGHVKLSDATNGTSAAASGGVAATPAAVKAVYDLANGKAPGGYGLGTDGASSDLPIVTDFNNATKSGFYYAGPGAANAPFSDGYTQIFVVSGRCIVQTAYIVKNANLYIARRFFFNDWGEWEYVNPPLALGQTYRTTERYLGKPVYEYTFSFGVLSNNSTVTRGSLPSNAVVISFDGSYVYKEAATNYGYSNLIGRPDVSMSVAHNNSIVAVSIKSTSDMSTYSAIVHVKYILA